MQAVAQANTTQQNFMSKTNGSNGFFSSISGGNPAKASMSNGFSAMGQSGYGGRPYTNQSTSLRTTTIGTSALENAIVDNNALKNLQESTKEDLTERLVVAEVVMKKLFARNKELEDRMEELNLKVSVSD